MNYKIPSIFIIKFLGQFFYNLGNFSIFFIQVFKSFFDFSTPISENLLKSLKNTFKNLFFLLIFILLIELLIFLNIRIFTSYFIFDRTITGLSDLLALQTTKFFKLFFVFLPLITALLIQFKFGTETLLNLSIKQIKSHKQLSSNITSIRSFVLPRLIALTFLLPVLNIIVIFSSMITLKYFYNYFFGKTTLDIYFFKYLTFLDIMFFTLKSIIYSFIIIIISSFYGLKAQKNTELPTLAVKTFIISTLIIITIEILFDLAIFS